MKFGRVVDLTPPATGSAPQSENERKRVVLGGGQVYDIAQTRIRTRIPA